jgi:hypothetical protein
MLRNIKTRCSTKWLKRGPLPTLTQSPSILISQHAAPHNRTLSKCFVEHRHIPDKHHLYAFGAAADPCPATTFSFLLDCIELGIRIAWKSSISGIPDNLKTTHQEDYRGCDWRGSTTGSQHDKNWARHWRCETVRHKVPMHRLVREEYSRRRSYSEKLVLSWSPIRQSSYHSDFKIKGDVVINAGWQRTT